MLVMIKTEPVHDTVKCGIRQRKREERRRKGNESERREDSRIKTGLQG